MANINVYLNFNGECESAFNFYKSVFGGEFSDFNRYSEAPPDDRLSADEKEWIMHVSLEIGGGTFLMGSDSPSAMGTVTPGNNFSISLHTHSDEESDRLFNGLAAGGQITMPLEKTFWGARFGMLVDRFGVPWMVHQDSGNE